MTGVIDYWCNLFTPEGIRACFTEQEELAEVFRWWKLEDHLEGYSPKEFAGLLDRAGVEMVLVPAAKMHSFRTRRLIWDVPVRAVTELVEQAPDRIRGLYGIDPRTARREAIRILGRLGIAESRLDRPVEQMSRGMQQKVAIARALLTSPTLLLLDEPTTGLDPRSKLDVQAFIEDLRDTHDATIVLTTHDLAEAERLCDQIVILDQGRVIVRGTAAELKVRVELDRDLPPTMESVFMAYTGRSLDDDIEEEAEDDD